MGKLGLLITNIFVCEHQKLGSLMSNNNYSTECLWFTNVYDKLVSKTFGIFGKFDKQNNFANRFDSEVIHIRCFLNYANL